MKTLAFALYAMIMISYGCKKDTDKSIKGFYESMHFVRAGGGQKDFRIYTTNDSNKLTIVISKYSFRDTTIQISIAKNSNNASSFSMFYQALNNELRINGDFQQSKLMTGSWAYIYFVSNSNETEVTNIELRNSLMSFEQMVEDKIQ